MNSRRSDRHGVLIRARGSLVNAISWLRAGYPDTAPRTGYCPLLALQGPASLTDHQIRLIADAVAGDLDEPTPTDIEAAILKVTDRLPHPGEVAQVQRSRRH